jgi:phosphopantothenoylcysteine synthetase/decarboxylase
LLLACQAFEVTGDRVLAVVVCGAGPAVDAGTLVDLALAEGWTVQVVATRSALPFLDVDDLQARTGRPVRSAYGVPGQPRQGSASAATALVVAPATFNFVNKLAAGIADDYALGVVAEAIGMGKPVAVLTWVNPALAGRAPFRRAVADLREEGVTVVVPPADDDRPDAFPWRDGLAALEFQTPE